MIKMNNFCPKCGTKRVEDGRFCINCGFEFPNDDNTGDDFEYIPPETNQEDYIPPRSNYEDYIPPGTNQEEYIPPEMNNENNNQYTYNNQTEYYEDSCPSCGNQMNKYTKSGLLSGGDYEKCENCNLEFHEFNNGLMLTSAPDNTRANNKFLNKTCTTDEWRAIFNNNLTQDEIEDISKYNSRGYTSINCPVCNNQLNAYEKDGFLSSSIIFMCDTCKTQFEEKNNAYKFINSAVNDMPLWKYYNQTLTIEEWDRIAQGGQSDRELEEIHRQEIEQKKQEDLQVFYNSLDTNNPLLPAVDSVGVVLKRSEIPVVKLENITLMEPRAVRTSTGGYGGTSIRIAKGVTIHTGGTRGRSVSHDEIKVIDNGELIITNKRIIFLGSNRTTNIDINKIVSIEEYSDGIKIQRSNKQKPEYFTGVDRNQIILTIENRQHTLPYDGRILRKIILNQIR